MRFLAPIARLYFNRQRDDCRKVWSLDFGPNTCEILASQIYIDGTHSYTEFLREEPSDQVRAYINFINVEVQLGLNDTITIRNQSFNYKGEA